VGWGDRTVDEMAHAWINIVYIKGEDFKIEQDKRRATPTMTLQQQSLCPCAKRCTACSGYA
jgi:hypothetical protein